MGMSLADLTNNIFGLLLIVFLFVTAFLWFLLPFAVFGIKSRMDKAIALATSTDERLKAIEATLKASRSVEPGVKPGTPSI